MIHIKLILSLNIYLIEFFSSCRCLRIIIWSFVVDSICGKSEDGGGDGLRIIDIGLFNDLLLCTELVIIPLVIVVQREDEIFIARFKCDKRLPCWYNALVERNCLWHTLHQNWFEFYK